MIAAMTKSKAKKVPKKGKITGNWRDPNGELIISRNNPRRQPVDRGKDATDAARDKELERREVERVEQERQIQERIKNNNVG